MADQRHSASDAKLIETARNGNPAAFDELIERHFSSVFSIAYARLGNREGAEDLAQEVFLRAFLKLKDLRDADQFGPWLRRMARNLSTDWLRREVRSSHLVQMVPMPENAEVSLMDTRPDAKSTAETEERRQAVETALGKLSAEERELLLSHFTEERTQRDIAADLGVNHTTVGRRVEKASSKLRGFLGFEFQPETVRPSAAAKKRTAMLIAAAAAMSAEARHSLAQAATETAQREVTSGLLFPLLQSIPAKIAGGVAAMGMTQKLIGGVALITLLGGGYVYMNNTDASAPKPPSVVHLEPTRVEDSISFGEVHYIITPGERLRLNIPEGNLDNLEYVDMSILEEQVRVVVAFQDGRTQEHFMDPEGSTYESQITNIEIWETQARCWVRSVSASRVDGGIRIDYFAADRPDILPQVKAAEHLYEQGQINRQQLTSAIYELFDANGLLPTVERNRNIVLTLLKELYK